MSYPINFTGAYAIQKVDGNTLTSFPQAYSTKEILYICGTGPATVFIVDPKGHVNQLETKATGTALNIAAANTSQLVSFSAATMVSLDGVVLPFSGAYVVAIENIKQIVAKAPYLSNHSTLYINANGQTLEIETTVTISALYAALSSVQPTMFTPLGTFASHAAISLNGNPTTANFVLNNDCILSKGLLQGDATKTKTEYVGYRGELFTLITVS